MSEQRFVLKITRFAETEPYTAKGLEETISDTFCGVTRISEIKMFDIPEKNIIQEGAVKLLIWNDETKTKEHGRPDPAYIIGLGSGSVLELKNNKDHTVLHMEVGEVM